jgi:hypothetical protein
MSADTPSHGIMATKFIVEATVDTKGHGSYVFARRVGTGDFRVPAGSTLNGAPLRPGVDIPRRILPDGRPDLDCFQFCLISPDDLRCFHEGMQVVLEPGA